MLTIILAVATTFAPVPLAQASGCDSNYEGVCVPAGVSDVDFAGGSGNGPEYVAGPVYVVGSDIYELDRDGDGTACEK
ncbi:excalibur calcium-binding domain-containing protein [Mycolicibacterium gadium]|uniref:Excalibur calcium-binding domain-containing protein n=1 Tax=Mycolicibacterium gadium TaxID=1794 RepID=A0ABT6GJ44_MYCGU|nr:excalibur calcium-binding domain-containing protein [Mycolicibacterium gadium]MDG5481305.1 excalibur calcium-binding domain-containing protein [Mycolicibacterium gadium]